MLCYIWFLCDFAQGRIDGALAALWVRAHTQNLLFALGATVQNHAGKMIFAALLILTLLCIGLKHAQVETNFQRLWIEGRQLHHISSVASVLPVISWNINGNNLFNNLSQTHGANIYRKLFRGRKYILWVFMQASCYWAAHIRSIIFINIIVDTLNWQWYWPCMGDVDELPYCIQLFLLDILSHKFIW